MLSTAEEAAGMEVGRDLDSRVLARVLKAKLDGADLAAILRPVLYPEDDGG